MFAPRWSSGTSHSTIDTTRTSVQRPSSAPPPGSQCICPETQQGPSVDAWGARRRAAWQVPLLAGFIARQVWHVAGCDQRWGNAEGTLGGRWGAVACCGQSWPPLSPSVISVFTAAQCPGTPRPPMTGPPSPTEAIQVPGLGSPQSSTRESDPRDGASRTKPPTTRLTRPSSRDTERPEARQPGTPRAPARARGSRGGWIVGEGGGL